jgi:hypothetical protein
MANRRDMLKAMGMLPLAGALKVKNSAGELPAMPIEIPKNPQHKKLAKPLTAIVIGAGTRGNIYASYAEKNPDELKIVGVAEPIPFRNNRFAKRYDIPEENRFVTWEHVFERPKFADIMIITTPDNLHYGPAMAGLPQGYDTILEKPVAQTWEQCKDILDASHKHKNIVAICHVMRYMPYFIKMREIIQSGVLGEIISVQHMEPIQHVHMSHSYVRGIWRRLDQGCPTILAKSCHDLDMMRWLVDKPCKYVSSFGSLKWFKKENAPAGAPMRCTDGCPAEKECPYSALKVYHRDRIYLNHMDLPEDKEKQGPAIMHHLKTGQFGRCVYHCDNDVVDHQIVSMLFDEEITVNFNMEAFTAYHGRKTRIMGSMGDIVGDGEEMLVSNFKTGEVVRWNVNENVKITSGHGGGDYGLVADFVQAVNQRDPSLLTSTIDASMESHLMGFLAEKSRYNKTVEAVDLNVQEL